MDIVAFLSFPLEHRRQIWSTNALERLNREVGRRCEVVAIEALGVVPVTDGSIRYQQNVAATLGAAGLRSDAAVQMVELRPVRETWRDDQRRELLRQLAELLEGPDKA